MGSENEIQQIEQEVKNLEDLLTRELSRSQRTARHLSIVTFVLVALIVGFVLINFFNFRSAYTEEKFSRSLQAEMQELTPLAMRELKVLGKTVLPVYAKQMRTQLADMGPEIAKRFESELDQLGTTIVADVHTSLGAAQERVLASTEQTVFESYPDLNDKTKREALALKLHAATDEPVTKVIGKFVDRFGKHVAKAQEAVLRFDVSDSHETPADLQKKFIHLWIQLLDQEIMEL